MPGATDEADVQAEAFQLVKASLEAATGDNIYQAVFDQLTFESAAVDKELAKCVKAQVTKASSFIDLLMRAQETVETTQNDILKLSKYSEEDDLVIDANLLIQQVGHRLSNAMATQELYEMVVSVPARSAVVAEKWVKRDSAPISVHELQRELYEILKNREAILKVPKQYLNSLPHSSCFKSVQLEKIGTELSSIASSFDNTFFKGALDLLRELFIYITQQMPALIFAPASEATQTQYDVRTMTEQFIVNLSAQETMEEKGAAKAWKAVVNTVYSTIVPSRYTPLTKPQGTGSTVSQLFKQPAAMAATSNDAATYQESSIQGILNNLIAAIKDDFAHIKIHIAPLFNEPAANAIVDSYFRGTGSPSNDYKLVSPFNASKNLTPNMSGIPFSSIFNLPLVYVSAVHNFVQDFLRAVSKKTVLTPVVLQSLIGFASSYTTVLDTHGLNWLVCRFPDAAYFQSIARNIDYISSNSYYTSWYSSLTTACDTAFDNSQTSGATNSATNSESNTSKYAVPAYNLVSLESKGKFLDFAPFSPQSCAYPCIFHIHDCVLRAVSNTWDALLTNSDKAMILDTVLTSIASSKGVSMQSRLKNVMLTQRAQDLFFISTYSLEFPMQSVIMQYKKGILEKFCKTCYTLQLNYPHDLDKARVTSDSTLITGITSTMFSIFLEQLHSLEITSNLGKSIFVETYNAACATIKNFIYDVLGNIAGIDVPMNIQYLCKVTDHAHTFNNLLSSDTFWSTSAKREGLAQSDFSFLTDMVGAASFISPQTLATELANKVDFVYKSGPSKFGSIFNVRRKPRQMLTGSTMITSNITSNRTSCNLTGVTQQQEQEQQEQSSTQNTLGVAQSTNASSDVSSVCGYSSISESLWMGEKLEARHYVALANDLDLISNSMDELAQYAIKALDSESISRSVIEAQASSVKEVVSEALNVAVSKLAYVILHTFRDTYLAKLFTPMHDQSLVSDLVVEIKNDTGRIMTNLSDVLQYLLQIELSNLLPAVYFCALFWRYYEGMKSNKDRSFFSTPFSRLYETDVECICRALQEMNIADAIVRNREKLMLAFEAGIKAVTVSTEELGAVSGSISGASFAAVLLMHPKVHKDDIVKKLSTILYKEVDFYRAPFLDRALYYGKLYSYEAACKEAKLN